MFRKKGKNIGLHNKTLITDINELFIEACENGDYTTVNRLLALIKDFNIDVTDNLGRSALRLAIENEHLEVVQVLLNKCDSQKMRDPLLLSIYLGRIQIAEAILRHPKYKVMNDKKFVNGDTDSFWQTPSSDDAQFSPDITPLMLAAQYNRTEIVQMLLIKGDRITKPHDFQCKCNECSNKFKFDSLRHAQSRLNAYLGLASESYISLASVDPILTAFELGHELKTLSKKEKYFKKEYNQLADNLSLYAVKLINLVRGRDELEIILNKTGKENEEKYERLARIDFALKYQEKPFVAHSNCQQKLVEIWHTGIMRYTKMNQLFIIGLVLFYITILPFMSIGFILAPKSKIGNYMNQPCLKFVAHTATYFGFIAMIIVSSLTFSDELHERFKFSEKYPQYHDIFRNYTEDTELKYRFPNSDFCIRMHTPSHLDYAISIFVLGFLLHEFKQIYRDGIKFYLLSSSNIVNFSMSILYTFYFALKYYTIILVNLHLSKINSSDFWSKVESLSGSDVNGQTSVFETFYWLNADRFYWTPMDPINLAEGLFATANILSFSRICFLLPALQELGPLQITLGKMISDIMKFMYIFLILFAGFLFALNNIFWYYNSSVRNAVEVIKHSSIDDTSNAEQSFSTMGRTLNTLFWSLFGLGDGTAAFLQPNYQNFLTESVGSFFFGAFHIGFIVVLLNMLIAMMTKSYEIIRINSDVEWKFARSKLYISYIKQGSCLPPPFNIIPTIDDLVNFKETLTQFIKRDRRAQLMKERNAKKDKLDSTDMRPRRNGVEKAKISEDEKTSPRRYSNVGDELTYSKVMQRIIKRFLLRNEKAKEEVNESNLAELKQDLQMVRFEMYNDLKGTKLKTLKSIEQLHSGLTVLGDVAVKDDQFTERFMKFKSYTSDLRELIDDSDQQGIVLK